MYTIHYNEDEKHKVIEKDQQLSYYVKRFLHDDCMKQYVKQKTAHILETNGKDYDRFKNLAGDKFCDFYIEMELTLAGIQIQYINQTNSEVPYTKMGILNNGLFTFHRAWYYWIVEGLVPLHIAKEIFVDTIGKNDVRVVGHCCRPSPEQWTTEINGELFIKFYHIDSLSGLKLFVEKIKQICV